MVLIRPRTDADLSTLGELLLEQQPRTGYPAMWPIPGGTETFLKRAGELSGFVAVAEESDATSEALADCPPGSLLGHVAVLDTAGNKYAEPWAAAHGCSPAELAVLTGLFTSTAAFGSGVGGQLFQYAQDWMLTNGRRPCLDVPEIHETAVKVYYKRGWELVGTVTTEPPPVGLGDVLLMIYRG